MDKIKNGETVNLSQINTIIDELNASSQSITNLTNSITNITSGNTIVSNSTMWNGSHKFISSAGPSGGTNGDIWFQYI